MKNMRDKKLANKWESKELGASDEHARKVSSDDEAVSSSLGLQTISIRLPKKLIDDLKYLASNFSYWPLSFHSGFESEV